MTAIGRAALQIFGPLLLIAAIVVAFLAADPLRRFSGSVPPVERLTVERHVIDQRGIPLWVRADGTEPVTIPQVQLAGAYWAFDPEPPGPPDRLSPASAHIPHHSGTGGTQHVSMAIG